MQTASLLIKRYRRKRIIICLAVALITLLMALSQRFISQRSLNQQQIDAFTLHAVSTVDKVLTPPARNQRQLLQLVGQPCDSVNLTLRQQVTLLQTLRSIALVKSGIVYCSSVLGKRNVPLSDLFPGLPASQPKLMLAVDRSLIKGSPVLVQWYPSSARHDDGVIMGINIHLLGSLLLEPQPPMINQVIISVHEKHYTDGRGVVDTIHLAHGEQLITRSSLQFPFSVSVKTPGAASLALRYLPSQLPLALILTLLLTAIAWVSTAGRISLSREISQGIAEREFEIYCQPLISTQSQQCIGVEILLRWQNPRLGFVSPEFFIPLAERHNLIVPLTRYVIAETVRQIDFFPDDADFHININVTASHFLQGTLLKDVNHLWFSAGPRQQLVLELTERASLQEMDYRLMHELHRKGVRLAIDDFGTGSSSLLWLEQLHPDILKIDKTFTSAIGTDAVNSTVTDIIIALGQRLNIELVAEGVETEIQAQYLRQHGVQILQGFLYAKPMPVAEFPAWLARELMHSQEK